MDSLNRHHLSSYGGDWVKTPNIERLAKRGIVFDNHYSGSLPCMPARREMFTGRLNFMEAPWGPIEPWDDCLPVLMRQQKQTYSHMITDHYHYFHSGGEAYVSLFDSWEFQRGQEGDQWHPLVKAPDIPSFKGKNRMAYWKNREFMDLEDESQYPTPHCFERAISFLDHNHEEDNWHLHLEVFDPHEPFVCPKKYRDMYEDTWDDRYHFDWPNYGPVEEEPEAVDHIRKSYAGALTMADVWLGKLLDKMDAYDLWQDTALIFTTDHGHLLGEHGYWAKNYTFDYEELVHLPLIMYVPESRMNGQRVGSLTATMDIMPTIMDLHEAKLPPYVHGKSMTHLLNVDEKHHDAVLYGYFGKDINLFDGRYTYCRQPLKGSNAYHHTAMPRGFSDFINRDSLARAETGVFLSHSYDVSHYRLKVKSTHHHNPEAINPIYDIKADPFQTSIIEDPTLAKELDEKMNRLMADYDAPDSEYIRVGLKDAK